MVDKYKIIIRNGVCEAEGLQEGMDGVIYGSLRSAYARFADRIDAIASRDKACDGAFVFIPAGVSAERDFVVENNFCGNIPDISGIVILERDSSARVSFLANGEGADFKVSGSVFIEAGEGARLETEEIVINGGGEFTFNNHTVISGRAQVKAVAMDLGCGRNNTNYLVDINGTGGSYGHSGLYISDGNDSNGYRIMVNHFVPDCNSDTLVKGIVAGNAKGDFKGMVYVAQDAQRTEAYQQSRNLLLSDTAQVLVSPQLEIYADDVKCSHGATTGQLDDMAVFYMMQRGLSEVQARSLQMIGFANDVISYLGDPVRREEITAFAQKRIQAL